jgi:hypothetical protein
MIRRPRGRSARFAVAGALAVGILTAFATVAGVGLSQIGTGSSQYEYGEYQYGQQKVVICHHTHSKKHPFVTIRVGAPAVAAHLKHHNGDHVGACTAAELASGKHKGKPGNASPNRPSTPDNGHGNGKGHGKGHGK